MTIHYTIHRYQYEIHNQYTDKGSNDHALLYLYDKDDNLAAVIVFVSDDKPLETPVETTPGHIALQFHEQHMPALIDMLRNEKPVMLSYSESTKVARISTQQEPVGEQELKRLFRFLYI